MTLNQLQNNMKTILLIVIALMFASCRKPEHKVLRIEVVYPSNVVDTVGWDFYNHYKSENYIIWYDVKMERASSGTYLAVSYRHSATRQHVYWDLIAVGIESFRVLDTINYDPKKIYYRFDR
jgi:hypothetical protein